VGSVTCAATVAPLVLFVAQQILKFSLLRPGSWRFTSARSIFGGPFQEVPALLLQCRHLAQHHFDVLALLLKNAAAFLQNLPQALDLRTLILGRIVHVNELTDFGQGQSQPLSAERELEAHLVAMAVDPVAARACGGDQSVVFVESDGPGGQPEFAREFRNGVSGVGHTCGSLRKRQVESNYSAALNFTGIS